MEVLLKFCLAAIVVRGEGSSAQSVNDITLRLDPTPATDYQSLDIDVSASECAEGRVSLSVAFSRSQIAHFAGYIVFGDAHEAAQPMCVFGGDGGLRYEIALGADLIARCGVAMGERGALRIYEVPLRIGSAPRLVLLGDKRIVLECALDSPAEGTGRATSQLINNPGSPFRLSERPPVPPPYDDIVDAEEDQIIPIHTSLHIVPITGGAGQSPQSGLNVSASATEWPDDGNGTSVQGDTAPDTADGTDASGEAVVEGSGQNATALFADEVVALLGVKQAHANDDADGPQFSAANEQRPLIVFPINGRG